MNIDYVLMGYQIQIVCRFVHKYDLMKNSEKAICWKNVFTIF